MQISESLLKHLAHCEELLSHEASPAENLQKICDYLHHNLAYYHWVGFYFSDPREPLLHLGPFAGAETEHTSIPYGRGICGQVALSGESYRSDDVQAEANYLACSLETRAELVVPLFLGESLIGQIDIDSHQAQAFSDDDERFLRALNELIAARYAEALQHLPDFYYQK